MAEDRMTLLNERVAKPRGRRHPPGDGKPHPGRRMTEREFDQWVDDKTRAEWVDGEVIVITPDNAENDDAGFWLRALLQGFVEHFDLGRVKGPNFTVRLGKQRRRRVPDVLFVAKEHTDLIQRTYVDGPARSGYRSGRPRERRPRLAGEVPGLRAGRRARVLGG
jgi:hypothetical protein